MWVHAGTIMSGTVTGMVARYHGWRTTFVMFGSLGVLLAVVLLLLVCEPVRRQSDEKAVPAPKMLPAGGELKSILKDIFGNRAVMLLRALQPVRDVPTTCQGASRCPATQRDATRRRSHVIVAKCFSVAAFLLPASASPVASGTIGRIPHERSSSLSKLRRAVCPTQCPG